MRNELFEQNLRKKLSTFEKEPPLKMWDKIEAELNERAQRRPFIWKRYAAVAAMLLLLLGSTFFMFNHNDNTFSPNPPTLSEHHETTSPVVTPNQSPIPEIASRMHKTTAVRSLKIAHKREMPSKTVRTSTTVESPTNKETPKTKSAVISKEPQVPSNASLTETTQNTPSTEPISVENAVPIDPDKQQEALNKFLSDGEQAQLAFERGKESKSSLLTIGMIAKGTPASTSSGLTNGGNTFSNRAIANFPDAQTNIEVPGKTFHLIPISVGVTIQKELGKGFSLETGLMYTFLYSTFEKIKEPAISKDQQSLHYLGIPLALKYEFLSFDKFYLFAKIGAMLEGNIYGEIRQSIIYPYTTFSHTEKVRDEKLQTSLFVAPGVAYKITRSIHLALEPSAQYYIPNGSNLSTIRTDQPFAFNLRLGISYNF